MQPYCPSFHQSHYIMDLSPFSHCRFVYLFPSMIFEPLAVYLFICTIIKAESIGCGSGIKCPLEKPCCSQYGECGTGTHCLGACDVKNSYNLTSCAPLPICRDGMYKFDKKGSIVHQNKFLGDTNKNAWITNGQVLQHQGNTLLAMAKNSYGTVVSSTHGIWYGKVSVTLKSSHGAGVVSAFILMSGAKDEIDFEVIGAEPARAQSNYYWQGDLNYTNMNRLEMSDGHANFHTYEIDWTPEAIKWSIDGHVGRELKKKDTWNSTTRNYDFPQTPSIVQLSLWPGGSDMNGRGTIEWAGGPIDWNMPEFDDPGYLFVTLKDVSISCYNSFGKTTSAKSLHRKQSYIFTKERASHQDIVVSDASYILGSPLAVGFDMERGKTTEQDGHFESSDGPSHSSDSSYVPSKNPKVSDDMGFVQDRTSSAAGLTASLILCVVLPSVYMFLLA